MSELTDSTHLIGLGWEWAGLDVAVLPRAKLISSAD